MEAQFCKKKEEEGKKGVSIRFLFLMLVRVRNAPRTALLAKNKTKEQFEAQ